MNMKNWIGQATTGAGVSTLLGLCAAALSGSLSWQQALPLAVGSLAALIWPENPQISAVAQKTGAEVTALVSALQGAQPAPPGAAASVPSAAKPGVG